MQVAVYNQKAEKIETMELPNSVFGLKWNPDLVHQVLTSQAANQRRPIAHAKGRGEVRGGGKKPWRQKGTGRARHGSIRSPIWKGGGITHGPSKEKNYEKKINKKMARRALYTALSAKVRDNEMVVLEDLNFSEAKTKLAANLINTIAKIPEFSKITKGNGVLVAFPQKTDNAAKRVFRNLPYVGVDEARNLNAHEVLQYKYILMPKQAIEMFRNS